MSQMGLKYSVWRMKKERNREKKVRTLDNKESDYGRASYTIMDRDFKFFLRMAESY